MFYSGPSIFYIPVFFNHMDYDVVPNLLMQVLCIIVPVV